MIPKISVIIPVYGVERYLREGLKSVQNQSLHEIEIICIDDGSKDRCPRILDEAAGEDSRISVIHQENRGYGYSINKGFDEAHGEYLAIYEPDDILPADALEKLYILAKTKDCDLVKGDYCELKTREDGAYSLTVALTHTDERIYNTIFSAMERPEALVSQIANWNGIFRRDLIEKYFIRLSETPGASYQDISLFFQLMTRAEKIYYSHYITYWYRTDNPNASTKDKGKLYLADQEYIKAIKYISGLTDKKSVLLACWATRWRGALGVFLRIDQSLYESFLEYIRPIIMEADTKALLSREYMTAYQWAMLLNFRKGNQTFLRRFEQANGSHRNCYRLFLRLKYDGIVQTLYFLKHKGDHYHIVHNGGGH